ncbi:hypothetical protein [Alteromonas sp. B31-7]|uniref:hypothetical protein n=1 Tax=Alteromonas sp. B31-7 TaxID=2785913 RepID=UPI0018CA1695|nr:hypothetical protein [Alteromonas sp. B31-7]QPL48522.1 hypothetical protein IUA53_11340 [Alteromonas sp. B31-7]
MENTFCTIITADYLAYAHVLYDSLKSFDDEVKLIVFVSDNKLSKSSIASLENKNIEILYYEDIEPYSNIIAELKNKYSNDYHDAYRWGMKPVLLTFLLRNRCRKAIYLDSDLQFFNDYLFLMDALDNCSILLSPHWRSSDPYKDSRNFELNFLDGMYNGGFVGASTEGVEALEYWAYCCLYSMERNRERGMHDDQKYLDILPSRYGGVESIRHMGCNIGNWNQIDCKRSRNEDGEILINNKYKIVFIHFTKSLFRGVYFGKDKLLMPYVEHYLSSLKKYGVDGIYEKLLNDEIKNKERSNIRSFMAALYRKIKF